MPFELTADVEVTRDAAGVVRALDHLRGPYPAEATTEQAAAVRMPDLAARYLADVAEVYGVHAPAEEAPDVAGRGRPDRSQPDRLVREEVQPLPDGSGTVAYAQLHANVDVWEAGVAISILASPLRVVASRSTWHHNIKLVNPEMLDRGDPTADVGELAAALGLDRERKRLKPTGFRWRIYQYDPRDPNAVGKDQPPPIGVTGPGPGLPVRPVPESVRPGDHFAVVEVLFAAVPTAAPPPPRSTGVPSSSRRPAPSSTCRPGARVAPARYTFRTRRRPARRPRRPRRPPHSTRYARPSPWKTSQRPTPSSCPASS